MITAIIVSPAGESLRVLAFTLDAFHRADAIGDVIIVCDGDSITQVEKLCVREELFRVGVVIAGGAQAGIVEAQKRGAKQIMIHEAALSQ